MKNYISTFLVLALLFQSCHSLKPIPENEAVVGKNYVLKLKQGNFVKGKLEKVMNDTLVFNINNHSIKMPKNRIVEINKQKLKKKTLIIGSVLAAGGIFLFINSLPDKKPEELISQ